MGRPGSLSNDRITPGVRAFVRDHIRSLEQLEILLLLLKDETRSWSAEAAARELRTTTASAAARLEEMASRNLLDVRIAEQIFYRYAPVSPALDAAAKETARAYKERPVAVTTAIYSQPEDEIRAFADAFRIRKKEGTDG
jgi:hypothetical protein